jgi:dihydrofolate reductase
MGMDTAIKCSVFIATSRDGFIARQDGSIDWLTGSGSPENSEDYGYKTFFDSIDTLVMGRNTFAQVLTFGDWPYRDKKVVVLSSRSQQLPGHLAGKVEFISGSPDEIVRQLADGGARHLYIDGGKTIQGFLRAGLIDEMIITTLPVLIGQGLPLFGRLERDIHLEHLETCVFPSGIIQSRYKLVKGNE